MFSSFSTLFYSAISVGNFFIKSFFYEISYVAKSYRWILGVVSIKWDQLFIRMNVMFCMYDVGSCFYGSFEFRFDWKLIFSPSQLLKLMQWKLETSYLFCYAHRNHPTEWIYVYSRGVLDAGLATLFVGFAIVLSVFLYVYFQT